MREKAFIKTSEIVLFPWDTQLTADPPNRCNSSPSAAVKKFSWQPQGNSFDYLLIDASLVYAAADRVMKTRFHHDQLKPTGTQLHGKSHTEHCNSPNHIELSRWQPCYCSAASLSIVGVSLALLFLQP